MVLFQSWKHPYQNMQISLHHVANMLRSSTEVLTEEFYSQECHLWKRSSVTEVPLYYIALCIALLSLSQLVKSSYPCSSSAALLVSYRLQRVWGRACPLAHSVTNYSAKKESTFFIGSLSLGPRWEGKSPLEISRNDTSDRKISAKRMRL